MGRRAKNKQAPPQPYEANVQKEPSKKLGKRKAQSGDLEHLITRPPKKSKDIQSKVKYSLTKPRKQDSKRRVSNGWEDVDDGDDLHTEQM